MTNLKHIFTNTMATATKLVRVTTYRQGFTLIKLQSPLIMSSYEITWKTKNIYLDCHNAIRSHDHLKSDYVRLCDKLETLNLSYHNAYDQQLVKVVKYYQELPPINLQDLSTTRFCDFFLKLVGNSEMHL